MVNLNFNIENHQLQINLATFPDECHSVVLNLRDGNHLAHHFNQPLMVDAAMMLENLPGLISEFVDYLDAELQEAHDRYSPVDGDLDALPSLDDHSSKGSDA